MAFCSKSSCLDKISCFYHRKSNIHFMNGTGTRLFCIYTIGISKINFLMVKISVCKDLFVVNRASITIFISDTKYSMVKFLSTTKIHDRTTVILPLQMTKPEFKW